MTQPTPVTVVRPYRSPAQHIGAVVGVPLGIALKAWLLMLLAPLAFNVTPSYWRCVAVVVVAGMFLPARSGFLHWTAIGSKPRNA